VSYKGTAPALTDLMSGQIQLLADPMLSSLPLAQSGNGRRESQGSSGSSLAVSNGWPIRSPTAHFAMQAAR
jgi:hypothetical protein